MQNKLILSIDDDPFYSDLYRNILEPKGYEFASALNPGAGHAVAKKTKPDLILLDVMMPENEGYADGYGLLEAFRKLPETKHTPILMISALGDDSDAKHGIELGADDYLAKQDMTPTNLVSKIAKLLDKKEAK